MKSIEFYYDFGSPTAYLAWTQIEKADEIIKKLLKDEFPKPGSARNRVNNSPEKGKTTLIDIKNA